MRWLKFKGIRLVANELAGLLIPYLSQIAPYDQLVSEAVLVPIPLYSRRLRQRGFNQAEEIANAINNSTGIPVASALVRTKATKPQALLPDAIRTEEFGQPFSVQSDVLVKTKDKKIYILVDDVLTSGSTMQSAAEALSFAIPETASIWAATVARG